MAALRNAGRLEDPKPVKPLLKTIDQRRAEEEAAKKEATPETPVVVKKEKTVEEMTAQEKMTYYTSQYENVKALFKASKDQDEKARLCQLAQIYCDGFRAAQAEIERMKLLDSIKSTRDGLADIPVLGR